MGEDPEAIRREIEQTRERMGETVDALGYKADVPARTKDRVSGAVDSIKDRVSGATPSTGDVKQGARQGVGMAKENPLGLAIGAVAVGFVAGLLVPTTKVEDEKLAPHAAQLRERAMDVGSEAVERGKEVAQEAARSAKETVQERGPEHAEGLRDTAQEHAQGLRDEVSSS
jgi:gas vesicle protein